MKIITIARYLFAFPETAMVKYNNNIMAFAGKTTVEVLGLVGIK